MALLDTPHTVIRFLLTVGYDVGMHPHQDALRPLFCQAAYNYSLRTVCLASARLPALISPPHAPRGRRPCCLQHLCTLCSSQRKAPKHNPTFSCRTSVNMPSWSALLVRLYIIWIRRSKAPYSNADKTRALLASLYLQPEPYAPPRLASDVVVERVDVSEWPLYRVALARPSAADLSKTTSPANPRPAMLYLHGGAWIREAAPAHWKFVAQVARETGLDVLVPVYPLLPRPTATARQIVDGLIRIVRLTEQPVVSIAGDSAGGCLALGLAQELRKAAPELAARVRSLVLMSPLLDCALSHPECLRLDKHDPWLGIEGLRVLIPYWTGGLPTTHPLPSPLFGEIDQLPPVLLLCGTDDILCSDARRLSARFQGQDGSEGVPGSFEGKDFTYVEQPGMVHVYPLLPHWEGSQARELIMAFVLKHLD
ncbi:Alpha/Beta hydrolase protein [Microdochium trichocladiopsis]|uniref:Alpha/Beta hydrolase protein n=1 Tax=Microdochium trichocladiopsis TaxID=1682393 RepID=A0A9P8XY99_9PEZI|nr:Alpha/Beta hydrolase protein [Microdochium trichocladiopsis]KAH7020768.1 Alpha/Beta hydrolase protein [Microdochium trichocladiopsis]